MYTRERLVQVSQLRGFVRAQFKAPGRPSYPKCGSKVGDEESKRNILIIPGVGSMDTILRHAYKEKMGNFLWRERLELLLLLLQRGQKRDTRTHIGFTWSSPVYKGSLRERKGTLLLSTHVHLLTLLTLLTHSLTHSRSKINIPPQYNSYNYTSNKKGLNNGWVV